METEVWPSLLFFGRNKFPMQLINGRLSLKSSLSFKQFGRLSNNLFGLFDSVLAQSQADLERYKQFKVKECLVTGNLKFDVNLPQEQINLGQAWKQMMPIQKILCAASTREGEEKIILQAWLKMEVEQRPLLILVPRHLTRVPEIEELIKLHHLPYLKRSQIQPLQNIATTVLLGDTMGEMAFYLSLADLVIMGGGWRGTGGQNLIEPIALGKPTIVGPSTYNFAQVTKDALANGVAIQILGDSEEDLVNQLTISLTDHIQNQDALAQMSRFAQGYAQSHQGATLKTLNHLKLKIN